jgi:hypothetical protein
MNLPENTLIINAKWRTFSLRRRDLLSNASVYFSPANLQPNNASACPNQADNFVKGNISGIWSGPETAAEYA